MSSWRPRSWIITFWLNDLGMCQQEPGSGIRTRTWGALVLCEVTCNIFAVTNAWPKHLTVSICFKASCFVKLNFCSLIHCYNIKNLKWLGCQSKLARWNVDSVRESVTWKSGHRVEKMPYLNVKKKGGGQKASTLLFIAPSWHPSFAENISHIPVDKTKFLKE